MKMSWVKTIATLIGATVISGMALAALPQEAQIQVDRSGLNNSVTVKYKGKTISLMELRVNGKSMGTRDVNGKVETGEANFTIDLEALVEGENTIEVRLFDKDGKLIGAEQTRVTVDKVVDGPAKIDGLKNGQTVQGFVDLKLSFKRDLGNVYVSFFVNGDFKSLRNSPPYSYMWDTATQPNGWYELEAWVVDDRNQTMKTNKIRVFVNNPGGRTNREKPATQPVGKPVETKPVGQTGQQSQAKPIAAPLKPVTSPTNSKAVQPKIPVENRNIKPVVAANSAPMTLDPAMSPVRGMTSNSVGTKPLKPEAGVATGQRNLTPTGTRVVQPKQNVVKPRTIAQTTPKVTPNLSTITAPSTNLPLMSIQKGTKLPDLAQFTILLNNQIVNFDVMPRVTNGVPLTPFRHLFEQAGGKVDWKEFEKVMTANGLGREIWVKIGDKMAKVNGKTFTLEMVPFVEKGRTIVPLSFIRESLNFNVQFDPNTGHVLITEKKDK